MNIETIEQLRGVYPPAKARAKQKQMSCLDTYSRKYISLSPFFILATTNKKLEVDASPRGGVQGFVQVLDDNTILIPDASGNNRLDSLQNIVDTGRVGLLFMIPGFDETLRVNGTATLHTDLIDRFSGLERSPKSVIRVAIQDVYMHCAKAFMRSKLWSPTALIDRSALPTMNEIIHAQTKSNEPLETQEQMLARYQAEL